MNDESMHEERKEMLKRNRHKMKVFLAIAFLVIMLVCSIDMTLNLKQFNSASVS